MRPHLFLLTLLALASCWVPAVAQPGPEAPLPALTETAETGDIIFLEG